jgi:hypothetical protein
MAVKPADDASSRPVDDRRQAIAQLRRDPRADLADGSRLTIELARRSTPAAESRPCPRQIRDVDAVGRLLLPPARRLCRGIPRGDLEIDGDVGAAIDAANALDFGALPRDVRRLVRWL